MEQKFTLEELRFLQRLLVDYITRTPWASNVAYDVNKYVEELLRDQEVQ